METTMPGPSGGHVPRSACAARPGRAGGRSILDPADIYNHRMVAIDPATGALVWQYGITGKPGTALGGTQHPGRLRPAAAGRINAEAPHDRMKPAGHRLPIIMSAIAIRTGTATTEAILRRFTRNAPRWRHSGGAGTRASAANPARLGIRQR